VILAAIASIMPPLILKPLMIDPLSCTGKKVAIVIGVGLVRGEITGERLFRVRVR
jgi:hypothetical protein